MIDRGALVLELPAEGYRGVHRRPLDAMPFTGRKGKDLGRRYTAGILEGDGVLEDLDEALSLRDAVRGIGLAVEVVVFEVPRVDSAPGGLEVIATPPAEGLSLLGWDVFESMEPWWSPISSAPRDATRNAAGLFATRREAERYLDAWAADPANETDEPMVVARIWVAE